MLQRILVDEDLHPAPVIEMYPVLPAFQVLSQVEACRKLTNVKGFWPCWQESNNKNCHHRKCANHSKWKADLVPDTAGLPTRICDSDTDKNCTAASLNQPKF